MTGQLTPDPAQKGRPRRRTPNRSAGPAFDPIEHTVLRWLGMAGFLINSRGTSASWLIRCWADSTCPS